MSAASALLSEDQFLCSICLEVFTDVVSTPCGHNFCKNCITKHWDANVTCECPVCKKVFSSRPELQVNMFVSEMVSQFRQLSQQRASRSSKQQAAEPGEVPCDVCTGTKLKALKSCLVCLVSYCETHLELHLTTSGLKKHRLVDPVKSLEARMCAKHDKLLELFCKDDQACVCMLCAILDHKAHEVVPLQGEYEGKTAELRKTEAELQQMIQKRQLKIHEFKESVKNSRRNADRTIAKTIEMIEEKHRITEKRAVGFIKELEQEIFELKKRRAELEQLSHSEDHLYLLQNFQTLNAVPPTKDWTEVTVHPISYNDMMMRGLKTQVKRLKISCTDVNLKWLQKYAVDVTLDPDTAHKNLILSEDGKQVHYGDAKRNLPDNPERFSAGCFVLGKQTVSSGRFYFEVQVKGKSDWILGVTRESINRKARLAIYLKNGFWAVFLSNQNIYCALTDPPARLSLKLKPKKVGVFVDYEEGLVAFYDVDAADDIYKFDGCSFTEKLLPFFGPCSNKGGKNSAPLIICPVSPTE